ncbi:hypothetical protein NUM3379_18720 [Kineococcus sp. NUM-3379]
MRRTWTGTAASALVVIAVAGCGGGGGVDDAEEQLSAHFLDPITGAGITAVVESACRSHFTDVDSVWHLETEIRLQAPKQDVIDALAEGGGVFIEDDREPRWVWQEGTQPGADGGGLFGHGHHGWHGVVSTQGGESLLQVTFNNAEHDGLERVIGWAETCPAL